MFEYLVIPPQLAGVLILPRVLRERGFRVTLDANSKVYVKKLTGRYFWAIKNVYLNLERVRSASRNFSEPSFIFGETTNATSLEEKDRF